MFAPFYKIQQKCFKKYGGKGIEVLANAVLGDALHGLAIVAGRDLGTELNPGGVGNEVVGEGHTIHHLDTAVYDRFIPVQQNKNLTKRSYKYMFCLLECGLLFVGHGHQIVNALNTNPVQGIGHHFLETGVTDTGDGFCLVEIFFGSVTTLLVATCVVPRYKKIITS